jgi:hypothetical protein
MCIILSEAVDMFLSLQHECGSVMMGHVGRFHPLKLGGNERGKWRISSFPSFFRKRGVRGRTEGSRQGFGGIAAGSMELPLAEI